jgi:hypothetical protein
MPATPLRLRHSAAFLLTLLCAAASGQTKSFTDAAVPVAIVAHPTFSIVDVLNQDRSITQYATESVSNSGYSCAAAPGLAPQTTTPHAFVTDGDLFEIGPPATGSGISIAPIASPNYTACRYGTVTPIPGSPSTLLLAGADNRHFRVFTVTGNGGSSPETITGFNSQPFYTSSGSIVSLGQATLDQGATYTSIVTDVDGTYYGDTAITELRTATTAGNLWIYNAVTGKAYKILAPDGSSLPAINAFIIHNPNDIEGSLLVLATQDGITANNITNPPLVSSPFAIIDLGQLHQLIDAAPAVTTITLPSIVRIPATAAYYATLGAAWNPVNHRLYAVVGAADANGNPIRQIFAYYPYTPTAPGETYLADVTSVPITPPNYPQIVLNGAANTMQLLTQNPTAAYSVPLNFIGSNTVTQLTGASFPSDSGFSPTAITVNPLTGDTWFTSSTGRVDALTLPSTSHVGDDIDMTGPLVDSYTGTDTGLQLLATFPQHFDQGLYTTNITVTATKAGGVPYTFASVAANTTIGGGTYISGSFPSAGIYTLTANFPGDSVFPAVTSLPVVVAVATPAFTTAIAATAKLTSPTAAIATVTLTGSTYAPTGTINIIDATSGSVLTSYTLTAGIATLKIPFTPGSSTSIKAQYLGDPLNSPSTSAAAVIANSGTAPANLAFSGPTTTTKNFTIRLYIALTSTATTAPTGSITLTATSANSGTLPLNPATVLASDAFVAGGAQIHFAPPVGGTYTLTATYNGDAVYAAGSTTATLVVTGSADTLTLTPPASANTQNPFNIGVLLASADTSTPTGNITITSQLAGGPVVTQGTVAATDAIGNYPFGVGVTVPGTYTFAASYPGDKNFAAATATTSVVVAGVAQILFSPTSVSFPPVNVGATATPVTVTLTNNGSLTLNISSIAIQGAGFAKTGTTCGATLAVRATCTVSVSFTASAPGVVYGSIVINLAGFAQQTLQLTGTGLGAIASLSASSLTFADQAVGTTVVKPATIVLLNTGNLPLSVSGVTGNAPSDFQVTDINCLASSPLQAGAYCSISVFFHPQIAGSRTGLVTVTTADKSSPNTVTLQGNGLNPGQCLDSDSDGLCDDWETNGVMVHLATGDKFVNLPAMGADPMHKDIFIHVDYMELNPKLASGHSHKPKPAAIAFLEKSFNAAYVVNPDKTTGIHLHIDAGSEFQMNPVTGALWGDLSAAMSISERNPIDAVNTAKTGFDFTQLDTLSPNYTATGRSFLFHHLFSAHDLRSGDTTSGISRNDATSITAFRTGASDLVMSLGDWPTGGTLLQQIGTIYHELGHNLSLEHGGRDEFNYKPNHLSVMNYNFQTVGIPVGSLNVFDYSQFALPGINEAAISEVKGINADSTVYKPTNPATALIDSYGTSWFCPGDDPTKVFPHQTSAIDGNIDWNCNKSIETKYVYTDINADGQYVTYGSVQEWPLLKLNGGSIGQNGAGGISASTPPASTTTDEIDLQRSSLILGNANVSAFGQQIVQALPGTTINLHFVVQNTGLNADTYTVTGVSALGWSAAKPTPASVTLAPGATTEIVMPVTVPLTATLGIKETLALNIASSLGTNAQEQFITSVYADSAPPVLVSSLSSLNFGTQATGGSTRPLSVMLTNTSASAVSLTFAASTEFAQANSCGTSLAPGAACAAALTFSPAVAGVRTGTLTVSSPALSAPLTVALTGTAVVVNSNPHPVILFSATPTATSTGQTVSIVATLVSSPGSPTPSGIVTFTDGTTVYGTQTANSSGIATLNLSNLTAGTYNLHASYPGDANYNVSTSPIATVTISPAVPSSASVASSAISAALGSSVTFTATITGTSGTSTPTGTVNFLDGTTLLGTATLGASATATFATTSLALGTHPISVSYSGDAVFATATSTAIQQLIVAPPDYSVTASPSSLTITHGQTGSVVFTVTPLNTYAGTVAFACGTLPASMSCTFSPTSVTFTKSTQTAQPVTLMVNTSAAHAALEPFHARPTTSFYAFLLCFPGSLLGLLAFRRKLRIRPAILMAFLTFAALVSVSGCGGSTTTPTTAAGTYSIPITITDGTTAHSLTYTITVQ